MIFVNLICKIVLWFFVYVLLSEFKNLAAMLVSIATTIVTDTERHSLGCSLGNSLSSPLQDLIRRDSDFRTSVVQPELRETVAVVTEPAVKMKMKLEVKPIV